MTQKQYLNLGCGSTYVKGWTNIDFVSSSEDVIAHNLLKGIPRKDNSFDLVYHSHVLEHFPKAEAPKFIAECYRVLKPGGVIRIAIPDLEQIATNYLKYMNEGLENVPGADKKYEWTMLEMYDQVVRERSGGEMATYIKDVSKDNDAFLLARNGKEVQGLMNSLRSASTASDDNRSGMRKLLSSLYHFNLRSSLEKMILGDNYETYKNALFRKQGEIHQWMYDRYSLKKILEQQGFSQVVQRTAFTSYIPEWSDYKLDGESSMVRKPDSLFIEAIK
jgi:predicted SAM-dependent methyltransferase